MGQIDDLRKARKIRSRKRAAKQFLILLILFIIVFIGYLLFDKAKEWDIKTRFNDMVVSMGSGPGFPVGISGREPIKFYQTAGMPTVLNDSNNYVYNSKGKTINNITHGYNIPIAESKNGRILIYDLGGMKLQVNSLSKNIISMSFDQTIINADISENGYFAVATSSDNYVGEVAIYNEKGKETYKWYSSNNIITDISISPKGDYLAVSAVNTEKGFEISYLYIFKIDTQTYEKLEFKDEYPISVRYRKNNELTLITNKSIKSFTNMGREIGSYNFSNKILSNFYDEGNNTALVFSEHGKKNEFTIVQLNNKMEVMSDYKMYRKIFDIMIDDYGSCITTEDKILLIDLNGNKVAEYDTPWAKKSLVIGDKLYYTTHSEIYKINGVQRRLIEKEKEGN